MVLKILFHVYSSSLDLLWLKKRNLPQVSLFLSVFILFHYIIIIIILKGSRSSSVLGTKLAFQHAVRQLSEARPDMLSELLPNTSDLLLVKIN